jgi:uridine kinase
VEQGVREAAEQVVAAIRARLIDPAVPFVVALDGGSGVGKSTLAVAVAAELGGGVVHTDDFFASHRTGAEWDASTAAEKADLAIDWQRLRTEALEPLRAGLEASWHPFDFATYDMETGSGLATELVTRQPTRVIVLDGIYSSRPELGNLVDLRVLVEAPALVRRQRHDEREATDEAMWHRRWDEAEDYYFSHVRPPESYDLVVRTDSADGYRVGSG